MATTYTGSASSISFRETPSITVPVDGDTRNAASVTVSLDKLADYLAYLNSKMLLYNQTNLVNGASGDTNPPFVTEVTPSTRKLIWMFSASTYSVRVWVYLNYYGELEFVSNCYWNGSQWRPNLSAVGFYYFKTVMTNTGLKVYAFKRAAEAGWADADFQECHTLDKSGMAWEKTSTDNLGSNPQASAPQKNVLRAKNTCKAWANMTFNSGTVTVNDGFNISSATVGGGADGYKLQVNFPTGGGCNSNYIVIPSVLGSSSGSPAYFWQASSVSTAFTLHAQTYAGTAYFLTSSVFNGYELSLQVYGEQTSP